MGFVLRIIADVALPVVVAAVGVWIAFAIVVWATGRDTLLDVAPAGAPPGLGAEGAVSEAAVASVRFDTGMRGYRTDQVDAALTRLAWEIGRKDEQLAVLQAKLDGTGEEPAADPLAEPLPLDELVEGRAPRQEAGTGDGAAAAREDGTVSEAGREDGGEAAPRAGT